MREKSVVMDWHEQFKRWAKPPSESEETKGANAAEMIRSAIRSSTRRKYPPALPGALVCEPPEAAVRGR